MKTIIITGASRGIGLATTKKFLDEGWRVIGTYAHTPIKLEHKSLVKIPLDLSSPESIAGAAAAVRKLDVSADVLVNSAGIILDSHDDTADIGKIRKTLEVDLFGLIDLTEQLIPLMANGAHIVNIDSLYGAFSFPIDDNSSTGYRLAKAALNMYTRTLAFRLKVKGITVSSLDPGWVKTEMGMAVATQTQGPDREPEDVAKDIYELVTRDIPSGRFWRFGKERRW